MKKTAIMIILMLLLMAGTIAGGSASQRHGYCVDVCGANENCYKQCMGY